jgi:hypothetical protein
VLPVRKLSEIPGGFRGDGFLREVPATWRRFGDGLPVEDVDSYPLARDRPAVAAQRPARHLRGTHVDQVTAEVKDRPAAGALDSLGRT